MARPKKNSTPAAVVKELNPYEGFVVSAFLRRAPRFAWRGMHYDLHKLTPHELNTLADDTAFKEIKRK